MKKLRHFFPKPISVHPLSIKIKLTHLARILVAVAIISLLAFPAIQYFNPDSTIVEAAVGTIRPDGDITTTFANCTGAACSSGYYAVLNDTSPNLSTYVSTGTNGATGDEIEFTMTSNASPTDAVTKVEVKFLADTVTCNPINSAQYCDEINARVFINGNYQSAQTFVISDTTTLYTATFNGTWVGDSDIQVELVRNARGVGAPTAHDDDIRVYQIYAEITYEPSYSLTQSTHRFFANTDSTDVGNPLAAQNASATLSSSGQEFRLRQSLHVTDGDLSSQNTNFQLQYVDPGTGTCQAPSGGTPATYTNVGMGANTWKAPHWEKRSTFQAVEFDGKMWLIGGYSGYSAIGSFSDVWYSTDGHHWTLATDNPGWSGREQHAVVAHEDKLWVIGGWGTSALSDVWSSPDGVNWTQETANADFGNLYRAAAVSFNNKLWVLGGVDGSSYLKEVWSSSDGVNWTQEANPTWSARAFHEAIVFDGKIWVMGGSSNNGSTLYRDVWSTTNGSTWTQVTNSANWTARETFTLAVLDNKMWVMGGWDGARKSDVWSSTNGSTWTQVDAAADWVGRSYHEAVGYDGKLWVMGGHDGSSSRNDVWSSANGSTWTATVSEITRRQGPMATLHDGEMWVAGGLLAGGTNIYYNDVYRSSDGINWTKTTSNAGWTGRVGGVMLSFDDKLWVMSGWSGSTRLNDVWSSTDGVTWTQETNSASWPARNYPVALTYDNKMWLMGGLGGAGSTLYNDVWSSTDGANWTLEDSSADWSARHQAMGVVHNDKMYVISGGGGGVAFQDVWSSTDGSSWTQETSSPAWEGRLSAGATVHDGKIWLYGGRIATVDQAHYNDLWSSTDGVTWVKENDSALWSARYMVSMLSHDDRIWLIGGNGFNLGTVADIRYLEDTLITWNDNPSPDHGDPLTGNANDPIHSGHTLVDQAYIENNPFTNQATIPSGQDGLWDFSLKDNGAPEGTTYCFRVTLDNGNPLNTYDYYPSITTFAPQTLPPIENVLRGGKGLIEGLKLPFFTNK